MESDEGGDEEEILKRSGAPEVSICSENEFPSYEKQDFQGSKEGKISKEAFRDFPLKAKEEGDENGDNED